MDVDGAGAQVYSGASTSSYGCCWKKKKSQALQNHPLKITGLMVKIRLETEHSNLCYFAVRVLTKTPSILIKD